MGCAQPGRSQHAQSIGSEAGWQTQDRANAHDRLCILTCHRDGWSVFVPVGLQP